MHKSIYIWPHIVGTWFDVLLKHIKYRQIERLKEACEGTHTLKGVGDRIRIVCLHAYIKSWSFSLTCASLINGFLQENLTIFFPMCLPGSSVFSCFHGGVQRGHKHSSKSCIKLDECMSQDNCWLCPDVCVCGTI